jgi:hypothetical protein
MSIKRHHVLAVIYIEAAVAKASESKVNFRLKTIKVTNLKTQVINMKLAGKIALIVIVLICIESIDSSPVIARSLMSRFKSKRPELRRLAPKSSGFLFAMEHINMILKTKGVQVKHVANTPIFKRGPVYKFKVTILHDLKKKPCYARINLESLSIFDCWTH